MSHSRRDFLTVGLKGLGLISLGASMPTLVPKLAFARQAIGTAVSNDNILVIVQMSGGNDGLNTLVPLGNDSYFKARPQIGLKDKLHKVSDNFALNPGMTSFKKRFDAGELAIIQGCGYPKPNRSHFESMSIWNTADITGGSGEGWIGHYLDHIARGTTPNALQAINIGSELPQALVNASAPAPSVQSIDDFDLRFDGNTGFDTDLERQFITDMARLSDGNPAMQFLQRQATNAIVSAAEIRKHTSTYKPEANYPDGLGKRLQLIAQLICGELGTRVFYVEVGGFDTHSNQPQQHENLLRQVSDSIDAFLSDMTAKGYANKVSVMCFSEFGRRVKQNDSAGTDHGAAAPMFLAGAQVKAGLHGTAPSLDDLDSGDLKFTTDFRNVYAGLLNNWLNVDATKVLGAEYAAMDLLKKA